MAGGARRPRPRDRRPVLRHPRRRPAARRRSRWATGEAARPGERDPPHAHRRGDRAPTTTCSAARTWVRTRYATSSATGRSHRATSSAPTTSRARSTRSGPATWPTGPTATPCARASTMLLSQNNAFFTLMQQFVGVGLVVGIAGIGVIMVRAVRERRRQVGRAAGHRAAQGHRRLGVHHRGVVRGRLRHPHGRGHRPRVVVGAHHHRRVLGPGLRVRHRLERHRDHRRRWPWWPRWSPRSSRPGRRPTSDPAIALRIAD